MLAEGEPGAHPRRAPAAVRVAARRGRAVRVVEAADADRVADAEAPCSRPRRCARRCASGRRSTSGRRRCVRGAARRRRLRRSGSARSVAPAGPVAGPRSRRPGRAASAVAGGERRGTWSAVSDPDATLLAGWPHRRTRRHAGSRWSPAGAGGSAPPPRGRWPPTGWTWRSATASGRDEAEQVAEDVPRRGVPGARGGRRRGRARRGGDGCSRRSTPGSGTLACWSTTPAWCRRWHGSTSSTPSGCAGCSTSTSTARVLACGEAVRRMSTRHGGDGGVIVNVSSRAAAAGCARRVRRLRGQQGGRRRAHRRPGREVGRRGHPGGRRPAGRRRDRHPRARPARTGRRAGCRWAGPATVDEVALGDRMAGASAPPPYTTGAILDVGGGA